jgi:hypothetical protein
VFIEDLSLTSDVDVPSPETARKVRGPCGWAPVDRGCDVSVAHRAGIDDFNAAEAA